MRDAYIYLINLIYPLLLVQSAYSATPIDDIRLNNFKVRSSTESIDVFLDDPSSQNESAGESRPVVELGVKLSNYGINLNNAKDLGNNKIAFDGATLELRNSAGEDRCIEVAWRSTKNVTLEDCFKMSPHNWYGGPDQFNQYWPIEQSTLHEYPYVTKDLLIPSVKMEKGSGSTAEPYWFNSNGLLIYVDDLVPLYVDQNNHRKGSLCLMAKHAAPYYRTTTGPVLNYTVCKFDNPRLAHEYTIKTFLSKPSGIPDVKMVEHPIWSTWAKFKRDIDEGTVLSYARAINDHGFNNSQLEIDDMWETCYGSMSINKTRFPNMKRLTAELKKLGFRTTIWVHPFVNFDCGEHQEAASKGYFVKNSEGDTSVVWWNGNGSMIDFTNPAAAGWHENRLRNLLAESGIDSFKFDAGESNFAPQVPVLNGPESEHPGLLFRKYGELAAKFGPMVEARSAKRSQNLPIFVRMMDRDSLWGIAHLGLHSVITTTLVMNMHGYPFVLPDMVGGNAYEEGQIGGAYKVGDVAKEMYIRWLQVNVFLPAIQFSIPPWDFDSETVELTKKYLSLHHQYAGKIVELMKKAVKTGQPINTPIWWVDPTNKEAHGINSEYMLGEDILVAPVLEKGATSRDIYLPKGQWRDEAKPDKLVRRGPVWLRDYPAPLDTLPYFTRMA